MEKLDVSVFLKVILNIVIYLCMAPHIHYHKEHSFLKYKVFLQREDLISIYAYVLMNDHSFVKNSVKVCLKIEIYILNFERIKQQQQKKNYLFSKL